MKIVFVTDQYWPSISGVPVSIDSFRSELQKQGHQVYILAPQYPDRDNHNDPAIFRFKSYKPLLNDENFLVHRKQKKYVWHRLQRIAPDLIHIHTEFSLGSIAAKYARKHKIPIAMTAHTNWEELIGLYLPWIPGYFARQACRFIMCHRYSRANKVIVPTSLMHTLMRAYGIKTPIHVIPTGINLSEFQDEHCPDRIWNKYPQLQGKRFIFNAGRIGKEKNLPFLINVFEQLHSQDPELYFVMSGDGPAMNELQAHIADKGLQERVILTGFINRQELIHYYKEAHVFVFASKVESQGLVVLEAMACGTPVVAIGEMGTREVMAGNTGGFMVDDDLDEFCQVTQRLLADPKLHLDKSKAALKWVQMWSNALQAQKLSQLYQKMIGIV